MNGTEKQLKIIEEYLETSYCGARMIDDSEMQSRISSALFALKADTDEDLFLESAQENEFGKEMKSILAKLKTK